VYEETLARCSVIGAPLSREAPGEPCTPPAFCSLSIRCKRQIDFYVAGE